jgi:CheY-like chemotaxis protein
MTPETTALINALASLLSAVAWPIVALFVVARYGRGIGAFFGTLSEFTLKGAGLEASAKRRQVEVAAALGAATASAAKDSAASPVQRDQETRNIADLVTERVTPSNLKQSQRRRILWVDDVPDNNTSLRRSFEALGIEVVISTSTEEALDRIRTQSFDVIISDMGRPPDPQAGYTLLSRLQERGVQAPVIFYASGGSLPQNKQLARERGAWGSTNHGIELFDLVTRAITRFSH